MIINFLQEFDSRIDSNNSAVVIFSANSVKCEDVNDYWGLTTQTLDENAPVACYFGNPTTDSLNYECVSIDKVITSMSAVHGMREAFYDLFKRADSDVLFLLSTNTQGWTKRTMELFKEYDIVPKDKEVILISLAVLHQIATDGFLAGMYASKDNIESLAEDLQYSRKITLNKLADMYQVQRDMARPANEQRCITAWAVANELMTRIPANEMEM